MICPACPDQTLTAHHRGGIQIDMCPNCHGIWLDRGELDTLAFTPPTPGGVSTGSNPDELQDDITGRGGERADSRHRADTRDLANDDRDDDDRRERKTRKKKGKKKKKASIGHRLGEVIDEIFDDVLDF